MNLNTISAEYSKKPQVTDWKEELQDCLHLNGVDVTVRILERSFFNSVTNFFSQYSKADWKHVACSFGPDQMWKTLRRRRILRSC